MSIAAWWSPDRGRAHRSLLVATSPVRDLLLFAKHLFGAAKVAGIHRTEIDRTATDACSTSGVSRVGPCPTPRYAGQGYPSRIKLGVPKIHKIQKSRGSEHLYCFAR